MLSLALTNFAVYEAEKERQCALYILEKNDTNGKPGRGGGIKSRQERSWECWIEIHTLMESENPILRNPFKYHLCSPV